MSNLHKDFSHALDRIATYLEGLNSCDNYTNVKAYLYRHKIRLEDGQAIKLRV